MVSLELILIAAEKKPLIMGGFFMQKNGGDYMWTREEAVEQLELWKNALKAVSTGQSYRLNNRSLTRVDVGHIMEMIQYFGRILADIDNPTRGRIRTKRGVVYDI